MQRLYTRWINDWENRLAFRATDRVVRPFEWGADWARNWPGSGDIARNGHSPSEYFDELNARMIASSDEFFGYDSPRDFDLRDGTLRFTSPVRTPYPENNSVYGRWFPAKDRERAVVVLPHFNATAGQHVGLSQGIRKLGISALRLSLPYHDQRMPAELHRADYAVSANIGRTIDATRQAVIDVRAAFDWLQQQGYTRLGLVGTSLGSCYAFLTSAHDPRLRVNVFNHCSNFVGDVVWTGLSTQHIRQGIEGHIDRDQLRSMWRGISPVSFLDKFKRFDDKKNLFIYTTYDTTFRPELSQDVLRRIEEQGIDNKVVVLPCGHYTMGESPFKFLVGWHICSFLKRHL